MPLWFWDECVPEFPTLMTVSGRGIFLSYNLWLANGLTTWKHF